MPTSDSPWLDKTLTDLLRENVERNPDGPAIEWGDTTLSFADLDLQSDRLATGLAEQGIGSGDVVSCQLPNIPEFLILHHAVAKRRAIFNPIHMPYRSSEMEHILGFAGSAMLVTGPPVKGFSYAEMGHMNRIEDGSALGHRMVKDEKLRDIGELTGDHIATTNPLFG